MNKLMQSFACVGLSAMLLAGCAGTNNAANNAANNVKAKSVKQAQTIRQNAVSRAGNAGANGMNQAATRGSNNEPAHVLQLGNWLRIVGVDDASRLNMRSAAAGRTGNGGRKGSGIPSYQEQSSDMTVQMTVDDPQAIQAIDRINQILSSNSVRANSNTLVKDLSYVLQHASQTAGQTGGNRR